MTLMQHRSLQIFIVVEYYQCFLFFGHPVCLFFVLYDSKNNPVFHCSFFLVGLIKTFGLWHSTESIDLRTTIYFRYPSEKFL